MARKVRNRPDYGPVASYPVAEHRYAWDKPTPDDFAFTYKEVREAAPYKVGDVVYVVYGDGFRKAIVYAVQVHMGNDGFWREAYAVFPETKSGEWSKLYYVAHPGYIQRGYYRAGLAPEMPSEHA